MKIVEAKKLAIELLNNYDLQNWNIVFDKAKKRFGQCAQNSQTISLSSELTRLNNKKVVKGVILHEIAHAIVGPKNGHNHIWKRKAIEINGSPDRYYDDSMVITPKSKYTTMCSTCGMKRERYRLIKKLACRNCCFRYGDGRYTDKYILQWIKNY